MKRTMCLLMGVMMVFTAARSQTNFGVKAGYNSASVSVSNGNDWTSRSGFHVGGLAHIHLTEHFAVQPEIVYSSQGGESTQEELDFDYINVPVLAQYMVGNGFRLQTGPQIGFLLSATEGTDNSEADIKELIKPIDLAWVFGAGYVFKSGFGIDARYNLGLSDINDNPAIPELTIKNRVFQVGLFYQFGNKSGAKK